MSDLIPIETIDSFIEANLPFVAMGHIGLVLILVIILFSLNKRESDQEPRKRDEENFSYDTGKEIMFRPAARGPKPYQEGQDAPPPAKTDKPDPNKPIVMEDSAGPESGPDDTETSTSSEENAPDAESAEEETPLEPLSDPDQKRLDKINEVLSQQTEHAIIAINREEQILDLNGKATELTQYAREDLEGKKIDEIIFLEAAEPGSDSAGQQVAKAERKDGSLFPVSVELEMADREFGIITVTLYPNIDEGAVVPEAAEESTEETIPETIGESQEEQEVVEETSSETEESSEEQEDKIVLPDAEEAETEEVIGGVAEPETDEQQAIEEEKEESAAEDKPETEEEPVPESIPEPAPAKQEPAGPRTLMPPPPPPPKGGQAKPLAPLPRNPLPLTKIGNSPLSRQPKAIDNKTLELFTPQLSQPLQSILQLAEMISADEHAGPQLKKYAIAIQAKSNRLMSQIEEMSLLANVQKGLIEVTDKPFNLSRMVTGLVDLATSVMSDQKQKIRCECEDQDLIIVSDEDHFEKILSNLINVALYAASDQEVSINLSSNVIEEGKEAEKTISYEGRDLQIGSNRRILIRADFPSDAKANHLFDIAVNRGHDNAIVHNVQNNSALKNHISSLRLVKELTRVVGGKIGFAAEGDEKGTIEISLEIPCAQVGSYPA